MEHDKNGRREGWDEEEEEEEEGEGEETRSILRMSEAVFLTAPGSFERLRLRLWIQTSF